MGNLSKVRRDKMIEFLKKLKEEHTDDESLIALNQIEKEIVSKRYGLVWEEHDEEVEIKCHDYIPVFKEVKNKEINSNPLNEDYNFLLEGDNLHSLLLLEKTHKGRIDIIYIDPPYNTGAKDWKYNNDYVDGNDSFRHSKWLSFMAHRLSVAKNLLTKKGVMIVAIDDYEYSHLYMLLEELFFGYDLYTVIINHHPQGGAAGNVTRTHEYAIFVIPQNEVLLKGEKSENVEDVWGLMRGGKDVRNLRVGRPRSFYAILVDPKSCEVKGVGPSLDVNEKYSTKETEDGLIPIYPVGKDGTERVWRYERTSMIDHINKGEIVCSSQLSLGVKKTREVKYGQVPSIWMDPKYNAGINGTNMLSDLLDGNNSFSYPKSLYTVEDAIKYLTHEKKDAIILDFFAGSGTTGHAVLELNRLDGGNRKFILCTNNENNICEEITYKRLKAVINGKTEKKALEYSIPANLKYYRTDFVKKNNEELTEELLKYIPEMIQLEKSVKFDGEKYLMVLCDEDADELEKKWKKYPDLKTIYISRDVLLSTEQEKLFNTVEVCVIPDHYFNFELREAGELW